MQAPASPGSLLRRPIDTPAFLVEGGDLATAAVVGVAIEWRFFLAWTAVVGLIETALLAALGWTPGDLFDIATPWQTFRSEIAVVLLEPLAAVTALRWLDARHRHRPEQLRQALRPDLASAGALLAVAALTQALVLAAVLALHPLGSVPGGLAFYWLTVHVGGFLVAGAVARAALIAAAPDIVLARRRAPRAVALALRARRGDLLAVSFAILLIAAAGAVIRDTLVASHIRLDDLTRSLYQNENNMERVWPGWTSWLLIPLPLLRAPLYSLAFLLHQREARRGGAPGEADGD